MSDGMRAATREMSARARVTFSTGASVWAEGENVVSFAVREGADSPLLPGNVLCAEVELELANDDGQWRFGGTLRGNRPLMGATVELFVRCGGEDMACGVFIVDSVRMDEHGGTVRLSGGDSVAVEMAAAFQDELSYPATLGQLWAAVVGQTRYEWSGELPNGAAVIDAKPEWNGASLRRAAGWIAQAAGCFVRVGRTGALEVVPCRTETAVSLTADEYLSLTDGLDAFGPVKGLRVTPVGAEEAVEISDGDGETVAVTENPLFQSGAAHLTALMRGMLDEISGLMLNRMETVWRGDPAVGVGARIALTDTFGDVHAGVITRQTLRFDRGFSAECACETPDVGDAGVMRAITPEGGLNAAALVGTVDGGKLAAGSVTARAIAAGSITAGKLAAGSVETDKLAAGAVTAGKIAAGAVEAEKLAAGSVTTEKLSAGAITAEKIAAGAVKAEKIEAGAVDTAQLAAGSVTAEKIATGTITADRLKAKTITAESGIIDDSAIGTAQIADGSITSAKIVELSADLIKTGTLSAERLLLVGEDGVIYRINAASSGLSMTELEKDQYKNYINGSVIVAKSITAAQIAAQSITGNEILAGSITAKEIDVSDLFADEATVNALNAMDIRGNAYLKLYVTDAVENIAVGGRNLYTGTKNFDGEAWTYKSFWTADGYYSGCAAYTLMGQWHGLGQEITLEANTQYTLSAWLKQTDGGVVYFFGGLGVATTTDKDGSAVAVETDWARYAVTFTTAASGAYMPRFEMGGGGGKSFWVAGLKLEKGNKATDWSPAPEDVDSAIESNTAAINLTKDNITALVSKVDNISVGGTNLILESGVAHSPGTYMVAKYELSEDWEVNAQYTLSIWGALNAGGFGAWRDNGYVNCAGALTYDAARKCYTQTFLCPEAWSGESVQPTNVISIYQIGIGETDTYGASITRIKLEKGNKGTDWSPAPEDPAGSLSVSSDYSKVDINTERVRIVSKQMEVAVPSDDGEDDVLRVDKDGVHAEVVEADMIVSESVVHTQGAASYAPANAGELAEILEDLGGKHLTGAVQINAVSVTAGGFELKNVSGDGYVFILGGYFNEMKVTNCAVPVLFQGSHFVSGDTALVADNSAKVRLTGCEISANVGMLLGASLPAEVVAFECSGDCATLATVPAYSRLYVYGTKPTGVLDRGLCGEVYNATSDPTFAAKADPSIPTTQSVTATLSATSTSTSGYGSKLYQGRYSSSQSLRKGVMLFTLPGDLTSADNIDSATLTLRRISGAGQGGGVAVQVRCYDVPGTLYASKTIYDGQTASIDVTAAVKAMKSNGYSGLMLYSTDTTLVSGRSYTTSYARFAGNGESGAPVLKVSYRK